jgi:hypothetical protein
VQMRAHAHLGNSMLEHRLSAWLLVAPTSSKLTPLIPCPAQERGFSVYVLPVERGDWIQVARAIMTLRFWRGALTTDPGYTW